MSNWKETEKELPPKGVLVDTKIDNGINISNEQPLKRIGVRWFLKDGSINVCYTPTHWKYQETQKSES